MAALSPGIDDFIEKLRQKAIEATRNARPGEPRCSAFADPSDPNTQCKMLELHPAAHRSHGHGNIIIRWWPVDENGDDEPGQIDGLYGAAVLAVNLVEQLADELQTLMEQDDD